MSPPAREDIIDLYDEIMGHVKKGDLKSNDVRDKYHKFLNMLAYLDINQADVVEIGQEFVNAYNSKRNTGKFDRNAPAESATPVLTKLRGIAKIFGGIGLAITLTQSFESRFRLENDGTKIAWDLHWKKEEITPKVKP